MIPNTAFSATTAAVLLFLLLATIADAVGTASTIAVVSSDPPTVCGIAAATSVHSIRCYNAETGQTFGLLPNASFSAVSGGRDTLCGLFSDSHSLLCWDNMTGLHPLYKRIYNNASAPLESLSVGDYQICGIVAGLRTVKCWRFDSPASFPAKTDQFSSISSGFGFSCGVLLNENRVGCWGREPIASYIETEFRNIPMLTISAGGSHACGLNTTGFVVCKGNNESGQLNVRFDSAFEYSILSLGAAHSCAIRSLNKTAVCWGAVGLNSGNVVRGVSFESITSGWNFTCGLMTGNLSVVCWGSGWTRWSAKLPLSEILPGPCVRSRCDCGIYPQSHTLCRNSKTICRPCENQFLHHPPPSANPPPFPSPQTSSPFHSRLIVFIIVGSVGTFIGFCGAIYLVLSIIRFSKWKVHNSIQPMIVLEDSNIARATDTDTISINPISRSSRFFARRASKTTKRQSSGPSSRHAEKAEEFTLSDLALATDNFSFVNKIGAGSFGVVYKGNLLDGREVAIKRGQTGNKTETYQEKESAFDSELEFLSRLHHKNLVRLVGYCKEKDERLLVYEYVKNGSLHDHLHDKDNAEKGHGVLNSWKMRIGIALDAARGIDYLHNYAVPPIIHRDIKSSNILLDADWTAKVSDFGLSLMSPELNQNSPRPVRAVGTIGYIDPECYGSSELTTKSDVYGLGVVLLELLTGRRAIFKSEETDGAPVSLVDYAVSHLLARQTRQILDPHLGLPSAGETEAVDLMCHIASHCVSPEGKDRPLIGDVVGNLEQAWHLCYNESHGSISNDIISTGSDETSVKN